jgi:hypothetical protein
MPARRTKQGRMRLLALLAGLPRSTRDMVCARRLAKNRPGSCHFENYLWQSLYQRGAMFKRQTLNFELLPKMWLIEA